MCETYADKIENLDYKTMRYPGHVKLMNFFFHELLMRENRAEAGRILTNAKPPVDEDVVYVHVAAEGMQNGQLRRKEFVRSYYPIEIGGKMRTAIAWTTLPLAVPTVLAHGQPGEGYPYPWAVYTWLGGANAAQSPPDDIVTAAVELGGVRAADGTARQRRGVDG